MNLVYEHHGIHVASQLDLFGFRHEDFIGGIDYAGAATFLPVAREADVTLFI